MDLVLETSLGQEGVAGWQGGVAKEKTLLSSPVTSPRKQRALIGRSVWSNKGGILVEYSLDLNELFQSIFHIIIFHITIIF